MPSHFHIQIETTAAWSLAETLAKNIRSLGLFTVDHRIINQRGLDSTVISDIYVRDDEVSFIL